MRHRLSVPLPEVREERERNLVALHEAGHVVMSFRLRVGVEEVSIVPSEDRLGVCRNTDSPEWRELFDAGAVGRVQEARRLLLVKHIQVSLAGPEAERLARGAYNAEGAAGDEETVRLLSGLLGRGAEEVVEAFVAGLRLRTARCLAQPRLWHAVETVALGLLERGRLTGEEAARLYRLGREEVDAWGWRSAAPVLCGG